MFTFIFSKFDRIFGKPKLEIPFVPKQLLYIPQIRQTVQNALIEGQVPCSIDASPDIVRQLKREENVLWRFNNDPTKIDIGFGMGALPINVVPNRRSYLKVLSRADEQLKKTIIDWIKMGYEERELLFQKWKRQTIESFFAENPDPTPDQLQTLEIRMGELQVTGLGRLDRFPSNLVN